MQKGRCNMTIELGLLITILTAVIAVLGYLLNKRNQELNKHREIKKDATIEAEMRVTLSHISKGVEDIKVDIRSTKDQMNSFSRDLVRVEESVKSAHKRIDNMEGK